MLLYGQCIAQCRNEVFRCFVTRVNKLDMAHNKHMVELEGQKSMQEDGMAYIYDDIVHYC